MTSLKTVIYWVYFISILLWLTVTISTAVCAGKLVSDQFYMLFILES
jgi:hypothetical protein